MYLCAFEGREGVKGVPTYLPTYLYVIESVCVCIEDALPTYPAPRCPSYLQPRPWTSDVKVEEDPKTSKCNFDDFSLIFYLNFFTFFIFPFFCLFFTSSMTA